MGKRERGDEPAPRPRSRALEIWLASQHLSHEERLERLAHDADLVSDLRRDNFIGEDWDLFSNELARYGMAVIGGWMRHGLIATRFAQRKVTAVPLPQAAQRDPAAIASITNETVAQALVRFRDNVLIPGVWDPNKGASVRTFFIGQCMWNYNNAVRRWTNNDLPTANLEDPNDAFDDVEVAGRLTAVEDDVVRSVTAEVLLRGASSQRAARALAMDACRYTNPEIAADLGMTVDAVASLLKRERRRLRHEGTGTGGKSTR